MGRTTITMSDELRKRLRLIAAQRGVSMAVVIREALEEKSASLRPKPKSIGIINSGEAGPAREAGVGRVPPRTWR